MTLRGAGIYGGNVGFAGVPVNPITQETDMPPTTKEKTTQAAGETTILPPAPRASDEALVADMSDAMALHGYSTSKHAINVDHERQEVKLVVTFTRSTSGQTSMNLEKPGKNGHAPEDIEPGDDD
jgi:hypothetical protein